MKAKMMLRKGMKSDQLAPNQEFFFGLLEDAL
jgi:hypothetical protein